MDCALTGAPATLTAATAANINPRNHRFTCFSSSSRARRLYTRLAASHSQFQYREAGAEPAWRKASSANLMPVSIEEAAAQQLFLKAQTTWSARVTPRFESFVLPCGVTFLDARCAPGTNVRFVVRLSDGRTYAETIPAAGAPAVTLVRGGYITGPAGAPLGFYRRWPQSDAPSHATPPPDLAEDPLRTIATVTAVDFAYRIALAGEESINGVKTAHLVLQPVRNPAAYPLRDLWIALDTDQVVRLTYEL